MNAPDVQITDITVDCSDAEMVAEFWSQLLQRPIDGRKGPYVWLARSSDGIGMGFQEVEVPTLGKNRLHIDISGPDVVAIRDRAEALGGRRVDGYEEGGFLVMADPEGNVFCIVPEVLTFDDSGRTTYLRDLDG